MITVAIAEVFFFVEFNPLSAFTGGENGLPGVPTPCFVSASRRSTSTPIWSIYAFLAFWYFVGLVHRAAHRALAGRRDLQRDPRQPAARRRRSATTSMATSSPLSSSPPPMPASPAACSA